MPNNAFYIVEEFLRSNDPQARKNALTALAVMDEDAECIERLGAVAVADADEGVRRRAVEEIVSLPDAALPHATRVLHAGLADEEKGQKAYAALGRLKGLGKSVPAGIPLSPLARLRRAWMMNSYLNPVRNMAYVTRAWKHGLIGAVASLVVLWPFYVLQAQWRKDAAILLPVLLILLAVLTCILATPRTTPINLYLDRKAAFVTETLPPVIFTLPLSILFIVLASTSYSQSGAYLALAASLPLAVGVVRAATLLSFGVVRRRRLNIAFQVCVAVATIFLLVATYNYVIWRDQPSVTWQPEPQIQVYDPDHDGPEPPQVAHSHVYYPQTYANYLGVEAMWVCLLPVAGALALAFASIDKVSPPVRPVAGRRGAVFSGITLGLSLALLAAILLVGRSNPEGVVNINGTFNGLRSLKAARDAK